MEIELSNKSFLVVDDHPAMQNGLAEMLYSSGVENVDKVARGEEAVSRIKEKRYDAVLCDYNLGKGQNGQQVLEEVKHRKVLRYSTVFIMLSGDSSQQVVMGAMEYKPDDYLTKPFPKELVITRLKRHFQRKQVFRNLDRALASGLYMKALDQCAMLLQEASQRNRMELLKLQGDLFIDVGDYDRAATVFGDVLSNRHVPWAQVGQAKVYYHKEDYQAAKEVLTRVIEKSPNFVEAYDWLSKTHLAQGDGKLAEAVLAQAVAISPKAILRHQTLARLAERNGDTKLAEKSLRSAIQLGKHSVHRQVSDDAKLANIYVKNNRNQEAMEVIKSMRKNFKGSVEAELRALVTETEIHRTSGHEKKALEALEKSKILVGKSDETLSSEIALDLARVCYLNGDEEGGSAFIADLVKHNIDDDRILGDVRSLHEEVNLEDRTQQLIDEKRKEIVKINNQGVKLFEEGKIQEAIGYFERAAKEIPNNKAVVLNMVKIMLHDMKSNGVDKTKLGRTKKFIDRAIDLELPGDKLKESLTEFHRLMTTG